MSGHNNNKMTLVDIQNFVSLGESETLELKKSLTQIKAAMETLCAFLNTSGGTIIIGANQKGSLPGQQISDNSQQEIARELKKIEPYPESINIQYIETGNHGNHVIVIVCNKGLDAPYTYDSRPFFRSQSSTTRMPQSKYTKLLLERGNHSHHSWEMQIVQDANIDDLDIEEINRTVDVAINNKRLGIQARDESVESVLTKLELITHGQITNAAMVLFAKQVSPRYSQCMIRMARFRGTTKLNGFIDDNVLDGNAIQIMNAASDFINKHLPVASFFDSNKFERIDKPHLPVLAVREALCNAICHKDYSVPNSAITLAIFDDRLEIWNMGTLPSVLSLEDLKTSHRSLPRNKHIAKVFYLRNYVESWGTGTTQMITLCKENELPEPIFSEDSGGFSVTFPFKTQLGPTIITEPPKLRLNTRQQAVLNLVNKHPEGISTSAIVSLIEPQPSARTIRNDLNFLKKNDLVKLDGYGASAVWTPRQMRQE